MGAPVPPASRTGAPRHTPALLRCGNGSEKAGPELCGRGSLEGTGFPAAAPGASLHPCCRRGGSSTSRGAATLPKAAARLSKQLHKAMINTLHPRHRSSWGPAPASGALPGGGTPCRALLPAEAGRTQPNGSGCSRVWQQLSARAGGCSRDGPPPAMPGQAVIPALTSASLWGEEHVERGVAAPRCMRGGHPSHANMPLWLFGTRHLRRSRPARSCTVGGSAAW